MQMCWSLTIQLLAMILSSAESARILSYFQLPSPSHHFIYRPVLEELAKRGHEIVYVTSFPYDEPPKGITQILLQSYQYEKDLDFDFVELGEISIISSVRLLWKISSQMAQFGVGSKVAQDIIHSDQKFDAVLFEPYFGQEYLSAFIHKFNAIGIDIVSLGDFAWMNELAGLPDNPSYQLDYLSEVRNDMNFLGRLYNTYVTSATVLGSYYSLFIGQSLMDQYFNYTGWETRPPIDVLARNRSLILVNFNHVLGYPYPVPPHRKDIGGINIKPNKPLPEDLKSYMDESKDGVIYMSLGSHMRASRVLKEMGYFLSVFRELPQRILLKFETEYLGELPPNVKMAKWFPQQDILAHNNCVLFITHGGLLSMTEALYHGVPLVSVPFFGDQPKNAIFAESAGFGRMLRFRNISKETLSWTIHEVLSNRRYKEEAAWRSKIFRDRRHTPAEEAAYWIEHSLKYPFSLKPKAASLSSIQLHLIDVKIFIASLLVATVYIIYLIINFLKNKFLKQTGKEKLC